MTKKIFLTGSVIGLVAIASIMMFQFDEAFAGDNVKIKIKEANIECNASNNPEITQQNNVIQEQVQTASQLAEQAQEITQTASQLAEGEANIQDIEQVAEQLQDLAQEITQTASQIVEQSNEIVVMIEQSNVLDCDLIITVG